VKKIFEIHGKKMIKIKFCFVIFVPFVVKKYLPKMKSVVKNDLNKYRFVAFVPFVVKKYLPKMQSVVKNDYENTPGH
jgi:hypothetical protein